MLVPKMLRAGGTAVCAIVVFLYLAVPMNASALSLQSDDEGLLEGGVIGSAAVSDDDAVRIRKLAGYIQDTYKVDGNKASIIVAEAMYNATRHDLEPELILAVIAVESTFRERAVSSMGARGLMQVIPRFHPDAIREIGGEHALFDPGKNIHAGSRILVSYLGKSNGNVQRALLRYNGSLSDPKSAYARRVLGVYERLKRIAELG